MKVEIAWIEAGYAAEVAAMTGEENAAGVLSAIIAAVAPLIAAKEREACAKTVDGYSDAIARLSCGTVPSVIEVACFTIAAAIRARQEDGA